MKSILRSPKLLKNTFYETILCQVKDKGFIFTRAKAIFFFSIYRCCCCCRFNINEPLYFTSAKSKTLTQSQTKCCKRNAGSEWNGSFRIDLVWADLKSAVPDARYRRCPPCSTNSTIRLRSQTRKSKIKNRSLCTRAQSISIDPCVPYRSPCTWAKCFSKDPLVPYRFLCT